jgi:3-oxosteroid 1-dehydrogenase
MQPNAIWSDEAETDVLVVGSGSAALTAALATSAAGLATAIVEKTASIGGTSAMSGGGVWVPANHHARAAGIDDSPEDTLRYLRATAPAGWQESEDALWENFARRAPEMLTFVEANSPLRFALTEESDPLLGYPGAKEKGRMLSPRPLPLRVAGKYRRRLRPPTQPHVFTYHEMIGTDLYHHPVAVSLRLAPVLLWRWLSGRRGQGTALVAGLLAGCLDHGGTIELNARAVELIIDAAARVTGAVVDGESGRRRITARRGVVLATGGFEWDREMLARYFPGAIDLIASPTGNEGDGHRMAAAAGAWLAHMDQANINPAIPSTYEGRPHGMAVFFHREANAILVDRTGRRFVDELTFNLGEVLDRRDPVTGMPAHLPAWMISDCRFLRKSPVLRWYGRPDPTWMKQAPSLEALAEKIEVPAAALLATVRRYNELCALGSDEDFHRGEGSYHGVPDRRIGLGLEPIETPPFVAIRFNRSILATKGGPRTNASGQVLREDGSVIAGLYCAGVAMANPIGTRAVGAGTTLGPNMTWGYICGRRILAEG